MAQYIRPDYMLIRTIVRCFFDERPGTLDNELRRHDICAALIDEFIFPCEPHASDTNVFLMVETAEGRRFCGKRHLCDQYLHGGGIAPIGNDVEMVRT